MSRRIFTSRTRARSWLASLVLASALAGCGEDAPTPPAATSTATPAPTEGSGQAPTPAEPSGPSATGATFALVSTSSESYPAGQVGQFAIELTGREGWHVNLEYPTVVQLEGEGLTFPNARLGREQAAQYAEERVRFEVPFTPAAAGTHDVSARVQFAMCNPSNCVPEERTLTLALAVQ